MFCKPEMRVSAEGYSWPTDLFYGCMQRNVMIPESRQRCRVAQKLIQECMINYIRMCIIYFLTDLRSYNCVQKLSCLSCTAKCRGYCRRGGDSQPEVFEASQSSSNTGKTLEQETKRRALITVKMSRNPTSYLPDIRRPPVQKRNGDGLRLICTLNESRMDLSACQSCVLISTAGQSFTVQADGGSVGRERRHRTHFLLSLVSKGAGTSSSSIRRRGEILRKLAKITKIRIPPRALGPSKWTSLSLGPP